MSGIVLGSGAGDSMQYIEPSAAVPLNNELGVARAEAAAAEEAVLWQLTGSVVDQLSELQAALDVVVWLDVVSARCALLVCNSACCYEI